MAIASSSTNAKTVLQNVGLLDYFDHIVDPTTLTKGKPAPEIFIKAAQALNIEPKYCVAIEDGAAGLKAIRQTEMFSVTVGDAVKDEPADWHVNDTCDITFEKLMKKFTGSVLACHLYVIVCCRFVVFRLSLPLFPKGEKIVEGDTNEKRSDHRNRWRRNAYEGRSQRS